MSTRKEREPVNGFLSGNRAITYVPATKLRPGDWIFEHINTPTGTAFRSLGVVTSVRILTDYVQVFWDTTCCGTKGYDEARLTDLVPTIREKGGPRD